MRKPLALVVAALACALTGCNDEKPQRGIRVLTDMYITPAYDGQDVWVTPDGATHVPMAMAPVAGTVSRNGPTYALAANDWAGAKALINPLTPTPDVLRSGQRDFEVSCTVCHGRDGNAAHAPIAPYFSGIPSLAGETYNALSDGEVQHIIARGRNNRMPDFIAQLDENRRWAVVVYLRALQQAAVATAKGGDDLKSLLADPAGAAFVPPPKPRPEYEAVEWVQPPGAKP